MLDKKKYKLKPGQENFTVMSGKDEGRSFVRGREYDRVPDGYADKFEAMKKPVPVKKVDSGKIEKPETKPEIPQSQINDEKPKKQISRR